MSKSPIPIHQNKNKAGSTHLSNKENLSKTSKQSKNDTKIGMKKVPSLNLNGL